MRTFIWITTIFAFFYSIITFFMGDILLGFINLSFAFTGLDIFYFIKPTSEKKKDEEIKFN